MPAVEGSACRDPSHGPVGEPSRLAFCSGGPDAGHKAQGPAFVILQKRHPFLRPVGMLVNHVRCVDELDSSRLKRLHHSVDVRHAEVHDGIGIAIAFR